MAKDDKLRVSWSCPAYGGQVVNGVTDMLWLAASYAHKYDDLKFIGWQRRDRADCGSARDELILTAMNEMEADWLIQFDRDTYTCEIDKVADMVRVGQQEGAALVGAPCLMRNNKGYQYNVQVTAGKWAHPDEFKGKVVQVDAIGAGLIAINLNWLKEHFPEQPWFQPVRLKGPIVNTIGVDIVFCGMTQHHGGVVLADGRIEPVHMHLAPVEWDPEDCEYGQTDADSLQPDGPSLRAVPA
jgi:hypothetical protein